MASATKKRKYKDSPYTSKQKGLALAAGQRGFLISCNSLPKSCKRESYLILKHYANELYGPETEEPTTDKKDEVEDEDVSDLLERNIKEIKQSFNDVKSGVCEAKRFTALETGSKHTVFIKTKLPNPTELAYHIIKETMNTKFKRTRSISRLLPIEIVCSASSPEVISKSVSKLFDNNFIKEPCTFCIQVKKCCNNVIKSMDIIHELAELVVSKNALNKVDLKNPKKTVVVEIIKGLCLVGILEDYFKYKKYNIAELLKPDTNEIEKNDSSTDNNQSTLNITSVAEDSKQHNLEINLYK